MTRFLLISDTHWGSDSEGYKVQPKYGLRLTELLSALESWIEESGPVDFVLHGGDMIHDLDEASRSGANQHFGLSVPVYLCLGNHDLTIKDGLPIWLGRSPQFFGGDSPDYAIDTEDVRIHVIPTQYETDAYFWGTEPQKLSVLRRS